MKLIKSSLPVVGAILLAASGTSLASEQDGQWYLTGMGTYINPDSSRGLDDGIAGGKIAFGRAVSERWNVELEVSYLDLDDRNEFPGNGGDAELLGGALNGMFVWNRAGSFSPYLLAGVGALNVDTQFDNVRDGTDLQLQAGPGFLWDLGTEALSIRGEVLGRWGDSTPSATDLLVNLGLQWSFGPKRAAPVAAAVVAAPVAAAVVAEPVDSDGDGVIDENDNCPGTPDGVVVDSQGCPLDSDNDGVADGVDQCPNSIPGAMIDATGCAYQLMGAKFALNSDNLTVEDDMILNELADRLKEFPDVQLLVEGHTDSTGNEAYNLDLSRRRAQSAVDYLVARGIAGDRFTIQGVGSANPVASNDTAEGRAANRRVEFKRR
jgi:OOP family OmpA-OmpF porin